MSGRSGNRARGRGDSRGGSRGGGQRGGGGGGRGGRDYHGGGGGRDGGGGRSGRGRGGGGEYRGGGGRSGGGGRGDGPPRNITETLTNIIPCAVSPNFSFYLYSVDISSNTETAIESLARRSWLFEKALWGGHLAKMSETQKNDRKRIVFFAGSFFFAARQIPGLDKNQLPMTLLDGSETDGDALRVVDVRHFSAPRELASENVLPVAKLDANEVAFDSHRCANCTKSFVGLEHMLQHCRDSGHTPVYAPDSEDGKPIAADQEVFISYVNLALQRALREKLAKWGRDFVDPKAPIQNDRHSEVAIYEAYSCNFNWARKRMDGKPTLTLTVDLRAKVIRTKSVLDAIYDDKQVDAKLTKQDMDRAKREWVGEDILYTVDKKSYTIVDLDFSNSAESLPVPTKGISHALYFERKGYKLQYPNAKPMIVAISRRNNTVYLPAELVTGAELDPKTREKLPQIASFVPEQRNVAIDKIKAFLRPGKAKGAGDLLPAIGLALSDVRIKAAASVMAVPMMMAAGVKIPERSAENWAPVLSRADFKVSPKEAVKLKVIVFVNNRIKSSAKEVYGRIRNFVNQFHSKYLFMDEPYAIVEAGDRERHYGAVAKHFSGKIPENIFVLDFTKPSASLDPAYPVIKQMLAASGHLSQFVNFRTYSHDNPRDEKKSNMILQGVSRQILQKCGARLWWIDIPKSLPLPAVFVGVDVFHAPFRFDPAKKERGRKASVAAIIVEVIRPGKQAQTTMELYTKSYKREGGTEHDLGQPLKETLAEAMSTLKVDPKSVIVYRDGISDSALEHAGKEEIMGIRAGVARNVPLAYIVCQKRIATKLLTSDGKFGAPAGTLVAGIQGLKHQTFYINGRAPRFSTPKPVRFIVVQRDDPLIDVALAKLTWDKCHDYPNWTGPIKVPSVCQMAHKLAELAGSFDDHGDSIDAVRYANRAYFL